MLQFSLFVHNYSIVTTLHAKSKYIVPKISKLKTLLKSYVYRLAAIFLKSAKGYVCLCTFFCAFFWLLSLTGQGFYGGIYCEDRKPVSF